MTASSAAQADDYWSARDREWFTTIVGARWAETRLPLLPYNIVTGKLSFDDAYLVSLGVSRVIVDDFAVPLPFTDSRLTGNSVEIEAKLAQHFDLEDNTEAVVALALRTGEMHIAGGLSMNFAWANGLSYAIDAPTYERGPGGKRGVNTEHLQYYLGLENEWSFGKDVPVHAVLQLHHRSGIYGLISPQKTGSNYMGAGLRIDLK